MSVIALAPTIETVAAFIDHRSRSRELDYIGGKVHNVLT